MNSSELAMEQLVQQSVNRHEFPTDAGAGAGCPLHCELEGVFDDFDRTPEIDPGDCVAHISRGNARYQRGDPKCEADYRAAFLLDIGLASSEVVQRLEEDIRDNVFNVLMKCRKHLRINHEDVVARTRLGLALLLLDQEAEAFDELRQVFRQSAVWRSFLRHLVNEARTRRAILFARLPRSS